jgi:hypothetical protein
MEQGVRREIIKMIQSTAGRIVQTAVGGLTSPRFSGNSLAASATIPAATTATDEFCVFLLAAPVNYSGLFDVRMTWAVTGITTGDSITWTVSTDYTVPASPTVVTGGTSFGGRFGASGTTIQVKNMFTNNATAGGITYTNGHTGTPGVTMWASGAQVSVTSALNQVGGFDGTVGASLTTNGTPVPFAAGNTALIMLYTTISAGSATWQSFAVDIIERIV